MQEYSIKREVNESVLLMSEYDYPCNHDIYRNIDKMQAFGGDNVNGILSTINKLGGGVCLTVSGSGDHPLEFVRHGFSTVYAFDINLLSRHMLNLKITAILNLSYEEFILFSKELFLNDSIIEKILPFLQPDTKNYFKSLFEVKSKQEVYHDLVTHKYLGFDDMIDATKQNFSFYNEKEFYELKRKLLSVTIQFKHQNLFENPTFKEKFDFMYFSNILLFNPMSLKDFKRNILPNYLSLLNENGVMILHYFHHFVGQRIDFTSSEYSTQQLNELALSEFEDVCDTQLILPSSRFGKGVGNEDMALLVRNKIME